MPEAFKTWPVGQSVIAIKKDNKYYSGTVEKSNSISTTVIFNGADKKEHMYSSKVHSFIIHKRNSKYTVGSHVLAKEKKGSLTSPWNIGFVTKVKGSGSRRRYRVLIDGYRYPRRYRKSQLRLLPNAVSTQTGNSYSFGYPFPRGFNSDIEKTCGRGTGVGKGGKEEALRVKWIGLTSCRSVDNMLACEYSRLSSLPAGLAFYAVLKNYQNKRNLDIKEVG